MSTFTQTYYHITFTTKNRKPVLTFDRRDDLFRYIWGIIKNKKCHLYRINGVEDHLHILTSLHPTVCLSDFIKDVKLGASHWVKEEKAFRNFTYWQDDYGAFTHSNSDVDRLIEYIKGQEEHHRKVTFKDEFKRLLEEAGLDYDEKYLD